MYATAYPAGPAYPAMTASKARKGLRVFDEAVEAAVGDGRKGSGGGGMFCWYKKKDSKFGEEGSGTFFFFCSFPFFSSTCCLLPAKLWVILQASGDHVHMYICTYIGGTS